MQNNFSAYFALLPLFSFIYKLERDLGLAVFYMPGIVTVAVVSGYRTECVLTLEKRRPDLNLLNMFTIRMSSEM